MFDLRENDLHYTRKHRRLGTNGSMTGVSPCNPITRKELLMNCFLWFMIGLLAGGFFGVGTMCIVQASRSEKYDELFDEDYEDTDWEELYD